MTITITIAMAKKMYALFFISVYLSSKSVLLQLLS
jgi:hypothetical protein